MHLKHRNNIGFSFYKAFFSSLNKVGNGKLLDSFFCLCNPSPSMDMCIFTCRHSSVALFVAIFTRTFGVFLPERYSLILGLIVIFCINILLKYHDLVGKIL